MKLQLMQTLIKGYFCLALWVTNKLEVQHPLTWLQYGAKAAGGALGDGAFKGGLGGGGGVGSHSKTLTGTA